MPLNPYIAGNPIGGHAGFYGREDIFRDVNQVLSHPQQNAIVLYGQRRIGKTSVLLQLERQLADAERYTPVYFDLMDRAGKPLAVVLWELTQRICQTLQITFPDRELFDAEGIYFRDSFLPDAAAHSATGGLVLLFDEFDVMDSPTQEQAGAAFFPYLRSWMAQATGVQFVFVMGRRPDDLSTNTISAFKGARATRVGLLSQRDAEKVIRLSEENDSLRWSDETITSVWNLTQGHPYFTQLLCETIWNQAYEEDEDGAEPPIVTEQLIEEAIEPAIVAGANAFVWLWDGLPPAERVVMSAIAEPDQELITHDELVEILNRSGVRLIISQLNLAPETLIEWGLLQEDDGGFKVAVPLLRLWVKSNRPLDRVKDELDRLDPLAENLFQSGQAFYSMGNLSEAQNQLQRSLETNPNHLKARLLLGKIFFEEKKIDEAIQVLDEAYQYDERAARADLVRALLVRAENEAEEAEQLAVYERILHIDRQQPVARKRQQAILAAQRKREIARQLTEADKLEAEERWPEAVAIYQAMLAEAEDAQWRERLAHAEQEMAWQQKYTQALGAQETGDQKTSQILLAEIIVEKPDYKEAVKHLLLATKEVDVDKLEATIQSQIKQLAEFDDEQRNLKRQNIALQAKVEKEKSWRWLVMIGGLFLLLGLLLGWAGRDIFDPISSNSSSSTPGSSVAVATVRSFDITPVASEMPMLTLTVSPTLFPIETTVPTLADERTAKNASSTGDPTPFSLPITVALGMTWTRPLDGMEMVFVPEGTFMMGSTNEDADAMDDEKPAHEVTLDAFWIDSTEVTNAKYAAFLNEMGNQEEEGVAWLNSGDGDVLIEEIEGVFQAKDGFADHPVVEVSWYGAQAYCTWAGNEAVATTLPTEAQWEYAARGSEATIYPWGDEFDGEKVNFCDVNCTFDHANPDWNDGFERTAPVASFSEGASWVGALDMGGNVWEWTADWYDLTYYENSPDEDPLGSEDGVYKVLRGGSWGNEQPVVRAATRGNPRPDESDNLLGFRCVAPSG